MNKKTRTRKEEAAYRKKLARVRAYSRDRSEWQKLTKMGNTTYPTLKSFRDQKYGKLSARISEKEVHATEVPAADTDGKLQRLLKSILEGERAKAELRSVLK